MASDEHERRRWHFKKELSLGDLMAVAGTAASIIWAYTTLDKRITRLEDAVATQRVIDTRQDEEAQRYQARIDEALREINRKLDWLIKSRVEERPR